MKKLVLLCLFLCTSALAEQSQPKLGQESLMYCVARGNLASSMARDVQAGIALDKINVGWPDPAANEQEAVDRDMWADSLKDEVADAIKVVPAADPDFAQKVGQQVANLCAYNYGAKRLKKTASNEGIADPKSPKARMCTALTQSAAVVIDIKGEMSKEEFWKANPLPKDFSEEMKATIRQMVHDAYEWNAPAREFTQFIYQQCITK